MNTAGEARSETWKLFNSSVSKMLELIEKAIENDENKVEFSFHQFPMPV